MSPSSTIVNRRTVTDANVRGLKTNGIKVKFTMNRGVERDPEKGEMEKKAGTELLAG